MGATLAKGDASTESGMPIPYDENLLERARTQWQFGDWRSLSQLNHDKLLHHPDRGKLALLAAAGRLQTGQAAEAKSYIRLAQDWGVSQKLISQLLIAGVHNSIARAATIGNQPNRAMTHFENAIQIGTPGADVKLLTQARTSEQLSQLGFRSLDSYQSVEAYANPQTPLKNTSNAPKPGIAPPAQQQRFSSDADIDDFIEDIAPFFCNRSIVYVDVGAYIGEVLTKLLDSRKIALCEAHLIEPNPASYKRLQDVAISHQMQSCNTYHIGISNSPGVATFQAAQSMTKRVRDNRSSANSSKHLFEVKCRRLDEVARFFTSERADLMKIDVEGEELDVLKSADRLLREQRVDVLYVEVGLNQQGTQQTYFGDIDELLQRYGYRVFKVYEQTHEWPDDSPLMRRCNAAYMSRQFASAHPYSKNLPK